MKFNLHPPALIFYVSQLGPDTAGEARGPVVRILNKYVRDRGLVAHELEHVRQFWTMSILAGMIPVGGLLFAGVSHPSPVLPIVLSVGMSLHSLLYRLVDRYRFWAELKAYAVQVGYADNKEAAILQFAGFISKYYSLRVTESEAAVRLRLLCK